MSHKNLAEYGEEGREANEDRGLGKRWEEELRAASFEL
jgi:hypothetical protein